MIKLKILILAALIFTTVTVEAVTIYKHNDFSRKRFIDSNRPFGPDIMFMSYDVASDEIREDTIEDTRLFSDLQVLQYYYHSDRSKGVPFFIEPGIWRSSSLSQEWSKFVSEKNAFTRKKKEVEFWESLDSLYESEWPSIYEKAKKKTLVFAAPVLKSKEFDFENMSKTISGEIIESTKFVSGIAVPERCAFTEGDLSPGGFSFVPLRTPIVLPPTSGTLVESLSSIDDPLPCSHTFSFNNSESAERFENIITSKASILFYYTQLKRLEAKGTPILEVKKVELWAKNNGNYEPTGFFLTVDESLGYEEYVQQLVDFKIDSSGASNKNLPKDNFFLSENIFSDGINFVQFFDDGQEMYLRKDNFGGVIARYVAETVNGQPVFRLDGADGQSVTNIPLHIFFPEPDAPYGGEKVIFGLGYSPGFYPLFNGKIFKGNLREEFVSNR
mgnify:CR=1 FL=1